MYTVCLAKVVQKKKKKKKKKLLGNSIDFFSFFNVYLLDSGISSGLSYPLKKPGPSYQCTDKTKETTTAFRTGYASRKNQNKCLQAPKMHILTAIKYLVAFHACVTS